MFKYTIELIYSFDKPLADGFERGFLVVGRQHIDPSLQVGDEFWLHWGAGNKFLVKVVERRNENDLPFSSNDSPSSDLGRVRTRILVEAIDKDALMELLAYQKTLKKH